MTGENPSRAWLWTALFLLSLFAAMRFVHLTDRAMHNDEGVNGFFTTKLLTENSYRYNPNNYHGPTLYYFQWIPAKIMGLNVFTVRFTTVCASLLFLAGFLFCRNLLGAWGALAALVFAGISTNVLFISRYFIHEIYVLLFTFGIFLGALRFIENQRPRGLYVAALSATLLLCTKETGVLHIGVMGLALLLALFIGKDGSMGSLKIVLPPLRRHAVWIVLMSAVVWILFFTSFFKNWHGIKDSFAAYLPWLKQGVESGHEKVWSYYILKLLFPYEAGLVFLALVGALASLVRNESKGWFLTFWAFGTVVVYSAIPYKTPWLVVNFVLPMALLSGYGVQSVIAWIRQIPEEATRRKISVVAASVLLMSVIYQVPLLLRVNYIETDNERHPQIYVHTSNQIFRLLADVDEIAKKSGQGKDLLINVVSPQYWPLPFYLKDYKSAKFWGATNIGEPLDAPLILSHIDQRPEVRGLLKETYSMRNYLLRPGYHLDLWINNNILELMRPVLIVPDLLVSRRLSGRLEAGLREEIFNNGDWIGAPVLVKPGQKMFRFSYDSDSNKPLKPPYSIRWTGFIKIPKDGIFKFSLDSDDGSRLVVDGIELIDNLGSHPLTRKSRSVNLSAGFHAMEIFYSDYGGTADFGFYWKAPKAPEEIVPGAVLFSGKL